MLAQRSLPGIRIEVAPSRLTEALPRMDVAVFVGFAARGPTHLPVVVESAAQFAAIFGPDAALAWDGERGERIYAFLGPTVRAFFANGGRRCWIIRVARTRALEIARTGSKMVADAAEGVARANQFPVSGVLCVPRDGKPLAPAHAQAGSVGSWSDQLRVSTALSARGVALDDCKFLSGDSSQVRIGFRARAEIRRGDLLEFEDALRDGVGAIRVFALVDRLTASDEDASPWIEATVCAAFETLGGPAVPPPDPLGDVELDEAIGQATLKVVGAGATSHLRLRFAATAPLTTSEGHWLRLKGERAIWQRVDTLIQRPLTPDSVSPPGPTLLEVIAEGPAWREMPATFSSPSFPQRARLLTIDLKVLISARI